MRLILSWADSERRATLDKSPNRRKASVPFVITTGGIRDSHSSREEHSSLTPLSSSQCVPLPQEDFEDEYLFSVADDIIENVTDLAMWQGGGGGGGGGEGGGGGGARKGSAAEVDKMSAISSGNDFVSVSKLHEVSFITQKEEEEEKERRGRKRSHPSDHEM